MEESAMIAELEHELEEAIRSEMSVGEIVALLRRFKEQGVARDEVYSFLETLRGQGVDEATDDRILEVADFVAGFCSPHMKIWAN